METKNIISFGIGVLIVYILTRKSVTQTTLKPLEQNKTVSEIDIVDTPKGTSIISEEIIDDPKISFCKEKWIKFAETRKFSSVEQEQATYDNFMTSCVAQA